MRSELLITLGTVLLGVKGLWVPKPLRSQEKSICRGFLVPNRTGDPLRIVARSGRLYVDSEIFHIKGVNWYGLEGYGIGYQGIPLQMFESIPVWSDFNQRQ